MCSAASAMPLRLRARPGTYCAVSIIPMSELTCKQWLHMRDLRLVVPPAQPGSHRCVVCCIWPGGFSSWRQAQTDLRRHVTSCSRQRLLRSARATLPSSTSSKARCSRPSRCVILVAAATFSDTGRNTRYSMWWRGTATLRHTSTTWRASWSSTPPPLITRYARYAACTHS